MAKSRGSVPVKLTGDPAHTGKTLECGRTAKTVLEDSWDKKMKPQEKKWKALVVEMEKKEKPEREIRFHYVTG